MPTITHKTGYLYQDEGSETRLPHESWHRTLVGACRAKEKNDSAGKIYRILSDDHTEQVRA